MKRLPFLLLFILGFSSFALILPTNILQTQEVHAASQISSSCGLTTLTPPSPQSGPRLVQDLVHRYDAPVQLNTTAKYIYSTGWGNYSFNKLIPWVLSYTSIGGNASATWSGWFLKNVNNGAIQVGLVSTVWVRPTFFAVNVTQKQGGVTTGYICVLYDFGNSANAPPKISVRVTHVTLPSWHLLWAVVGYQYAGFKQLHPLKDATGNPVNPNPYYDTSVTATLGVANNVSMSTKATTTDKWKNYLKLDFSDYGTATVSAGLFGYQGTNRNAITVNFGQTSFVDPTLAQSKECDTAGVDANSLACAFTSNVTSGNLLVIMSFNYNTAGTSTITDSQSNTYTERIAGPVVNTMRSSITTASAGSSAADTVTATPPANAEILMMMYEYSGSSGTFITASNSGTGTTASIASTAFQSSQPVAVFVVISTTTTTGYTPATGFTSQIGAINPRNDRAATAYDEQVASYGGGATTISTTIPSAGWGMIVLGYQATVTQPVTITVDNSGTGGTATLSGCGVTDTTQLMDGVSEGHTANASCTITVTLPADATNTRHRTASDGTSYTIATCSSGTCSASSTTVYLQLRNLYQASPLAQTTWDELTDPTVVGTLWGTASSTLCTIDLVSGGGAASTQCWGDYNRAAVIGTATLGGAPANSQWLRSGSCSFTETTGGNTRNCNYYKQWTNTVQITANAQTTFDSGLTALQVSGTVSGSTGVAICSITITGGSATATCSGYVDNAGTYTIPSTISTPPANSRWIASSTASSSITSGGGTVNFGEYKQWTNNFLYSVTGGGSPTAPTLTCNQLGSAATLALTLSAQGFYCDNSASATATNPTADSTSSERFHNNGQSFTITAGGATDTFAYYHEYAFTLSYSISDALAICSAPALTATQFGAAYAPTLATSGTSYWLDNSQSWSIPSPLTGSTAGERCSTGATTSGTVSSTSPTTAGGSLVFAYYHQYYSNNPSALTFNIYQLGTLVSGTTATTFWADVGNSATLVGSPYSNDWTLAFANGYFYQTSNGIHVYMNTTATAGALPTWGASALTVTMGGTKVHAKMYVHPNLALGYTKTTDSGTQLSGDTFSGNYLDFSGSSTFISYFKVVVAGGGGSGGGSGGGTTCLNGYTLINGECIPNSQISILNQTSTQTTTQQAGFGTAPPNKFVESGPLVIAGVIASIFGGAAIFGGVRYTSKRKHNPKKDVMGGSMDWGSMKNAFKSGTGKKVKEAFQ